MDSKRRCLELSVGKKRERSGFLFNGHREHGHDDVDRDFLIGVGGCVQSERRVDINIQIDGKVPCAPPHLIPRFECLEFVFSGNGQNIPREVWVRSQPEFDGEAAAVLSGKVVVGVVPLCREFVFEDVACN